MLVGLPEAVTGDGELHLLHEPGGGREAAAAAAAAGEAAEPVLGGPDAVAGADPGA